MKRVVAFILVLLMSVGMLAGCATTEPTTDSGAAAPAADSAHSQEATSAATGDAVDAVVENVEVKEDVHVAFIHSQASIESSAVTEECFRNVLKARGFDKWQVDVSDADGDTSQIASLVENAISSGADAIVIAFADLRSSTAAMKAAYDAGIPVITIDAGGWVEYTVCDIMISNYEIGARMATYMLNKLGSTGNIIIFNLDIAAGCRQRYEALNAVLNENSGIKVLENYNVDVTKIQQDTMDAMEQFLSKYGIENIDAVYCTWDAAAYAVSLVLTQHGYTNEDCFVVGMDGHWNQSLSFMQTDKTWPQIASGVQPFDQFGEVIVDLIYKMEGCGQTPEQATNHTNCFYFRAPIVTIDSVDELETGVIAGLADDVFYGDYSNTTDYIFSWQE